jgi:hypothetical protein
MQISKHPKRQEHSHNATDCNQNPKSVPVGESLYDLLPSLQEYLLIDPLHPLTSQEQEHEGEQPRPRR